MAYNQVNRLKKIIEVQELYLEKQKQGLSNREIWRRFIHPSFHISERTMYNYLAEPAKRDLKKLTKEESEQ